MMHVVLLTSEFPPLGSGGIGFSMRHLAHALVGQGHRVSVVGWGGRDTEFCDHGVHVRFVGHTGVPKIGCLLDWRRVHRELLRLNRQEHADVVEAHDWGGPSAGMRLDCPLVVRCHGADTYFAYLLNRRVRPSVRWSEWLALRQADDAVAVSRFTADVTRRIFRLRRPIGVIPNGIDITQFAPGTADEEQPDTILYFGSLVRKKGVLDVCRIFNRIVEARPRARLSLVGKDARDRLTNSPSTWALCQSVLSANARTRVEYVGAQPYERVQDYLHLAAVCIFPSYAEAFPLSWLEAMACGKPVVAYDIGWAPEVVEHEVTGLLLPAGDIDGFSRAALTLLANPEQRHRLGQAGRRRVESRFTAGIMARESVRWYQQVLAART